MEIRLKIILILSILFFMLVIVHFIKKDDISIKYSLIWLISFLILIISIMIPNFLELLSHILGFELVSNMVFLIAIFILIIVSFIFTIIVSRQAQKIRLLIQEVSMLKRKIELLDAKENTKGKKQK